MTGRIIEKLLPALRIYAILAAVGAISIVFGAVTGGGTICPLYGVVGVPCPGCGLTRAFSYLFHLDFAGAFASHPLFWVVPLFPILYLDEMKKVRLPAQIGLMAALVAVYAVRMATLFPGEYPMVWNKGAVVFRLMSLRAAFPG